MVMTADTKSEIKSTTSFSFTTSFLSSSNPNASNKNNNKSKDENSTRSMPLHSGISALIQAAESKFGHLIEEANTTTAAPSDASDFTSYSSVGDDCASSTDGEQRATTPVGAPSSDSESEPKRRSFPEMLMTLLRNPEYNDVITFLPGSKFFAIRSQQFAKDLMFQYFQVTNFDDFLSLTNKFGFTRVSDDKQSGIQLFRHPPPTSQEGQGPCSNIITTADGKMTLTPDRSKIEHSLSEDSSVSTKRRLSPNYARRESETSVASQKQQKIVVDQSGGLPTLLLAVDSQDMERHRQSKRSSDASRATTSSVRSLGLSKLDLQDDDDLHNSSSVPLEDAAVKSFTKVVTADALKPLLYDEEHTRQTYEKHKGELSKSSFPGMLTMAKAFFSDDSSQPAAASDFKELKNNTAAVSKRSAKADPQRLLDLKSSLEPPSTTTAVASSQL